ncbi:MAG: cobalamin biosynthesis protein [Methanobacterium sp.]|nr:cobalamin biosynthesis protein [Methanobacterium sp.]
MELLVIILLALFLDLIWGELPSSVHPVVMMGKIIDILKPPLLVYKNRLSGFFLTVELLVLFIIPLYFILQLAQFNMIIYILLSGFILFTTFAIKGLIKTSNEIKMYINTDIVKSRQLVSYLVSRDTGKLSQKELISATVESLTENITDSVISPFFYTFILGILGGMAYRIINTLDAMVGYKNKENIIIGWFPARFDDLANYIPARITGIILVLSAALMGLDWRRSYRTMREDARKTPSPNSGYPMAAAAGALGVQLVKKNIYTLGEDINPLNKEVIDQAVLLTEVTIIFFLTISFIIYATVIFLLTV